jgi:elongator complex protein 2
MKKPVVDPILISANPSTHRGVFDWSSSNKLIAFAAGPLVYISSLPLCKTFCSLKHHKQSINAVKWLNSSSIISAGSEGTLMQWQCKDNLTIYENWELHKEYTGAHSTAIELLSVLNIKDKAYMLSYSIDGKLNYWRSEGGALSFSMVCSLDFGKALLEAIDLYPLNDKANIIVIGGFTSQIHLYLHVLDSDELVYKCTLLGHQNSIRDFAFINTGDLLLASGSMDSTIRLWKIRKLQKEDMKAAIFKDLPQEDSKLHEQYRSKTSYVFEGLVKDEYYNIVLESLLTYHTEGINSLEWGTSPKGTKLRLLSGGIDGAICCWEPEETTWNVVSTFGEMNAGTRNAVYRAQFCGEECTEIVVYTYNGCIFRWIWKSSLRKWEPGIVPTGHFGSVNDVTWDPSGQFLVSCSSDMQTKVYGKCSNQWHEISRPQVHGYEINSIITLPLFVDPHMNSPFRLISAADEKVLRVFDAPYLFNKTANELSSANIKYSATTDNETYESHMKESTAISGSINQPLTLMNKPVSLGEEGDPSKFNPETFLSNRPEQTFTDITYLANKQPPQEHFLSNYALWPETQKMYGHAYEIQCLAISHNWKFIASSAKSNKAKDSFIIIWDSQSLKEVGRFFGHQLSVTQMEFSHDDSMLLSVGRDRQWILFNDYLGDGKVLQKKAEAHKRVIWGCDWADKDDMFVTASREKKESVKFWVKKEEWVLDSLILDANNVSAIRFFPGTNGKLILGGMDEGDFIIWARNADTWNTLSKFNQNIAHGTTIKKILFNKKYKKEGQWLLASGSADTSVRIFTFTMQ